MAASLEDHTFGFLLRSITPLVVTPLGLLPPRAPRLRGVVRAGEDRARIVVTNDESMVSGVAVEFALATGGQYLNVEAAIDYVRTAVAPNIDRIADDPIARDSHGNRIIDASHKGFDESVQSVHYDHSLFGLFSLLVHGGGFPWFEEVYTFAGFMLRSGEKCRIYIRSSLDGEFYGIEIPLKSANGQVAPGFGGSLPQELAPLVREGDLMIQPAIDDPDDYCVTVFDMTTWVDPPPAPHPRP